MYEVESGEDATKCHEPDLDRGFEDGNRSRQEDQRSDGRLVGLQRQRTRGRTQAETKTEAEAKAKAKAEDRRTSVVKDVEDTSQKVKAEDNEVKGSEAEDE